jgi:hypothetical protein
MPKRRTLYVIVLLAAILISGVWSAPGPAYRADGTNPANAYSRMFPTFGYTCSDATYASGTLPYNIPSTTSDGTGDDYYLGGPATCAGGGTSYDLTGVGDDFVYMVATDIDCTLGVSMDPDDTVDLALYVLYPDCDNVAGNCVIVDDEGGAGVQEDVDLMATAGQSYYVIVDGYNGDSGGYGLTISELTSNGCQLVDLHADLGDTVWEDSDADGIQEAGETNLIDGVTVNLYECGGALVDSTTTDFLPPSYMFIDVDAGDYYLEFVLPDGYEFSPQDQGVDDEVDSDVHPGTGQTECYQLAPGEWDTSWDAGMYQAQQTFYLGDRVWYDTDQDGVQDGGEPGVAGIIVADLYDNSTCAGSSISAGATGGGGLYSFSGLSAGTYCLSFSGIPVTWFISPKDQPGDDSLDSDADALGRIQNINLSGDDLNEDMGLYAEGSTGDRVWCDANGNYAYDGGEGRAGVTVRLYDDPECDAMVGSQLDAQDTIGDGYYLFDELAVGPPGGPPVCYLVSVDANDMGSCDIPCTSAGFVAWLEANNPDDLDNDFGFSERPSLGDLVWRDRDCDGIQDAGEPGVGDIAVHLHQGGECPGGPLFNTTTDGSGHYSFPALIAGSVYCLKFYNIPSGWSISPANQGSNDALDSDANPGTAEITWITLPSVSDVDEDMGLCAPQHHVYLPYIVRR